MRHHKFIAIPLAACLLTLAGCSGLSSYVETEDAALGRVVVYRNGIAYFERKAHVDGDRLTMKVPRDKVDDFLKSLTVTDARTGDPWPVSFPTRAASKDGTVEMVIQLPKSGSHDLVLSYITESPAWKPSYRLQVDKKGGVKVQGWAIVDNTSGEDWKAVRLGVGSSSALSFRYDLRTVQQVHRETLGGERHFAQAPPRGGSLTVVKAGDKETAVVQVLRDADIPRSMEHPEMVEEDVTAGPGDDRKTEEKKRLQQKLQKRYRSTVGKVAKLAAKLKQSRRQIVLEGYADANERDGKRLAEDRAHSLRNELIRQGIAPARLVVKNRGHVAGRRAGVRLVQHAPPPGTGTGKGKPGDDGQPIGESHFESQSSMTVGRGTSAMVSILDDKATGEVVYLYDAEARRGNQRYAFKAVRFKNPTDSTLESGPVTVYGNKRFIGEGLSDPIPPHQVAFIPFALDRQVVIDRKGSTHDEMTRLITVVRGVVTAEVQHTRRTKLTVTSRLHEPTTVYVRHTVRDGWKLTKSPKVDEKLGESHLFAIKLAARETRTITIDEATPLRRTIDLRSSTGLGLVRLYLNTPHHDKRFEGPMRELLKIHADMANTRQHIDGVRERMADYRERLDELQIQVVNLQHVKRGGKLLRHLKSKMMQISNRLQKSTIRIVDLQERLMLAKIKFQDGLSELSLTSIASAATAK